VPHEKHPLLCHKEPIFRNKNQLFMLRRHASRPTLTTSGREQARSIAEKHARHHSIIHVAPQGRGGDRARLPQRPAAPDARK
jgi:hypothetical protein